MVQRLVISNISTGLETDRIPPIIPNDAFPRLNNAYCWRGRVLRKRGDQLLGRLRRNLTTVSAGTYSTINGTNTITLFTALGLNVLEPNAAVIPETLTISFAAAISQDLEDTLGTGILDVVGAGPITSATINYSTGIVSITANAAVGPVAVTVTMNYYPVLPVMGIEDFDVGNVTLPIPICFDTRYSYGFDQGLNQFYDVTFYKDSGVPFTWNGENYEQFWTTNYLGLTTIVDTSTASGCLWATNGEPGFHFVNGTYVSGTGTMIIQFTFTSGGSPYEDLIVGDVVWFNEWSGGGVTINGVSGIVSTVVNAATGTYDVTFTSNQTVSGTGIAQLMTNSIAGEDGIRWYDGDPQAGAAPHTLGWVNFAPPLSQYNSSTNPNPLYLVGAKMVLPFKNRLLFFGVYLRTSAASPGTQFYPNRVEYSQVGTPFYTNPLPEDLVGQSPDPAAWYTNVAGRGGFISAPIDDQIVCVGENDDLLITIFETQPLKLIFTSDDTLPFIFQTISAELGALSTFSGVKLDTGVLSVGSYGLTMCTSTSTQRIDLQIPDQVFDFAIANNKTKRVTAIRDYQKEFVYFTYCPGIVDNKTFPSRTLLYNYRENNWATFDENYTTYGTFRRSTTRTWSNIGQYYPTWADWTDPWDFGANQAFFPVICGGNQHGFVMQKGLSVVEEGSQIISSISGNTITSPSHGLSTGDFIEISEMLGSTNLNGTIQQIVVLTENTFSINEQATGTYLGEGVYARIARPNFQTKQFPMLWADGRGMRLGTTRFLLEANPSAEIGDITAATRANPCQITSEGHGLSNASIISISGVVGMTQLNGRTYNVTIIDNDNFTLDGVNSTAFTAYVSGGEWTVRPPEITVNIFTSQNGNTPSNDISVSSSYAFTATVLTSAEPSLYSTANPPYESQQAQIWHRLSTSINGDSVQLGFTLSNDQMFDPSINQQEIILHAIVLDLYPGPVLAL